MLVSSPCPMRPCLDLRTFAAAIMVLATTMGHGDGCCASQEPVLGPATEATCPPASQLTYASFGEPFMAAYCTRCHSSQLTGSARMGAPAFHDFDSHLSVQQLGDHIDQTTGAGPAATNESMPPDGPTPTLEERTRLAEWIACGLP